MSARARARARVRAKARARVPTRHECPGSHKKQSCKIFRPVRLPKRPAGHGVPDDAPLVQ